jgi:hypothetical protein
VLSNILLTLFGLNRAGQILWGLIFAAGIAAFFTINVWLPGARFSDVDEYLFRAARHGDVAGINSALSNGAGINDRSPIDGKTALARAAILGHADAVRALLDKDADVNIAGYDGQTPGDLVTAAIAEEKDPAAIAALKDVAAALKAHQ